MKASTCLHETRLACGSGSLSLGTYDAPTSYNLLKFIDIRHLLRDAHFFLRGQRVATTRAQGNAPVEEKQPDPEKRQDVLVERIVWAWDHMMHKYTISITDDFTMDGILLQVGMGGFIGLVGSLHSSYR